MKKTIAFGVLLLAGLGFTAFKVLGRNNYETVHYTVEAAFGELEIRAYEKFLVAEVRNEGQFKEVMSTSFKQLAGYIFGDNKDGEKISMTTPVLYHPSKESEFSTMAFILPSEFSPSSLPEPQDKSITFREEPSKLMAALRFSGVIDEDLFQSKSRELLKGIREQGYQPKGEVLFYGYDPPAVPGALRRNEVIVEIGG